MTITINTILFPTDFSEAAQAALQYATFLAAERRAKLVIAHVEPPRVEASQEARSGRIAARPRATLPTMRDADQQLQRITPPGDQVPYQHLLLFGDPAAEIVEAAEAEHADLIVMGTHGETRLTKFLLGSVAEKVVRRAPCPVLTLKEPQQEVA